MLTLFIDTHTTYLKIGLLEDEKVLKELTTHEKLDHSTTCMPTIINIMTSTNKNVKELTDIIVVNGPGSFTGERLGVTIAKTLAYTLNIPIRTITSIETCLSTINLETNTYLSLSEKNGYFLALYNPNKELINDYFYLSKTEYEDFKTNNNILEVNDYDLLAAAKFAHQKTPLNPHLVNPFYVKKIEAQKWLEKL